MQDTSNKAPRSFTNFIVSWMMEKDAKENCTASCKIALMTANNIYNSFDRYIMHVNFISKLRRGKFDQKFSQSVALADLR